MRPLYFLVLLCVVALPVSAQEAPPSPDEATAQSGERIVDGRPALYTAKQLINPLTWVEGFTRPIFRSSQSGLIRRLISRKPNPRFRMGLNGAGAGSGFGPQFTVAHDNLFNRGIEVDVPVLYTYKQYEKYEAHVRVPIFSETFVDRLTFDVGAGYHTRSQDSFYGIGNETSVEDQEEFRSVSRLASAGFSAQLSDAWKSGLHFGYRNTGLTNPRADEERLNRLSTGERSVFDGLFDDAKIRSATWSIEHDARVRDEGLPHSGGLERFEAGVHEAIGKGDYSYWKYRVDLQRFFALTSDKRKVIALRAMMETNQEKGGSRVPFFDMPIVGNWDTVRGLENYRFHDKSAMSASIEYRYRIWRPMDWAIFVDVGQVAPEPGDFGFGRFHTGYGMRMIAMPKPKLPITVDIARSREKWRWYVNFNPTF